VTINYRGISPLPSIYKILPNIHNVTRLTPYTDKIIGDDQCGFQHNRSTTDIMFCIHQILEKTRKYSMIVYQLFIDCEMACDSEERSTVQYSY